MCLCCHRKRGETERETLWLRHEVTQNPVCFHHPLAHTPAGSSHINTHKEKVTNTSKWQKLHHSTFYQTEHSNWGSSSRACKVCTQFLHFFFGVLYAAGRQSDEWMGVHSWRSGGTTEITLLTTVTSACSHTQPASCSNGGPCSILGGNG